MSYSFIKSLFWKMPLPVVRVGRHLIYSVSGRSTKTVFQLLWDRAAESSAEYIEERLGKAMVYEHRQQLWDFALTKVTLDGFFAEFGVFSGASINHFARKIAASGHKIYGFDSFEGLKEDWHGTQLAKGAFSLGGKLPKVRDNVVLVKGWFDATVPEFLRNQQGATAFLHLDADTYESTAIVLQLLTERIKPGTVIVFDEYLGFPNWRNGVYLAWQQHVERTGLRYEYLGFSTFQAAVRII